MQLYFALDCGNMYVIALYCTEIYVVVVVGLSDSNTTPGYATLLYSALDCGNMYVIALYCKDKNGGVVVGLSDGLWQLGDPEQSHNQMNNIRLNCIILNRWNNYE